MKPKGLEHINSINVNIKVPLSVILKHQQLFPELTKKMELNPADASRTYGAFLCMLPLQAKARLTAVERVEILKQFKL